MVKDEEMTRQLTSLRDAAIAKLGPDHTEADIKEMKKTLEGDFDAAYKARTKELLDAITRK